MLTILTITNTLSMALQRKNQDIINAVNCVRSTKSHLDKVRRDGWEKLLGEVYAFCSKHDIFKLEMDEVILIQLGQGKKQKLQTSIIFKLIVLTRLLIGCYKSLIVALMKLPQNCLYVHLHSIHKIYFRISMWTN